MPRRRTGLGHIDAARQRRQLEDADPLGTLVGHRNPAATHIGQPLDITEAFQRVTLEQLAALAQRDDFRRPAIDHAKQAVEIAVVGDRREVAADALDRSGVDGHPIARQPTQRRIVRADVPLMGQVEIQPLVPMQRDAHAQADQQQCEQAEQPVMAARACGRAWGGYG